MLGEPVDGHKAHLVARRGLAHVPEDRSLFFGLTVDGGHTIRKFPWLEDVARSIAGEELFAAIERGEAS